MNIFIRANLPAVHDFFDELSVLPGGQRPSDAIPIPPAVKDAALYGLYAHTVTVRPRLEALLKETGTEESRRLFGQLQAVYTAGPRAAAGRGAGGAAREDGSVGGGRGGSESGSARGASARASRRGGDV